MRRDECTPADVHLQQELLDMAGEDLRLRAELAADGSLFEEYHPRMRAVHDRHAARLARVLAEHGWPGESLVGVVGAQGAWLIVQHAIAEPVFQRVALEDRIRIFEGRPQRYGTQFDWDAAGQLNPLPIEDRAGLDERRRAPGLRPLAEELVARRDAVRQDRERPPADWNARQRQMEAWLREVGWRA